jgi:hypothetical protein
MKLRWLQVAAHLSHEHQPDVACRVWLAANTLYDRSVSFSQPEILDAPKDLPEGRYELKLHNGQVFQFSRLNGEWTTSG